MLRALTISYFLSMTVLLTGCQIGPLEIRVNNPAQDEDTIDRTVQGVRAVFDFHVTITAIDGNELLIERHELQIGSDMVPVERILLTERTLISSEDGETVDVEALTPGTQVKLSIAPGQLGTGVRWQALSVEVSNDTRPSESDPVATPTPEREPIVISIGVTLEVWPPEVLSQRAELVIVGTVERAEPSRWTTESGQLPEGTTLQTIRSDALIYTDFIVAVEEVLKGETNDNSVRVRVIGGTVGQDRVIIESEAKPREGRRVLLFLTTESMFEAFGSPHYTVVGSPQGLYEIEGDEAVADGGEFPRLPVEELRAIIAENQ